MRLNDEQLSQKELWEGFELPQYDREQVKEATRQKPCWVHFGAGNIFRAFPAMIQQRLLNQGKTHAGIIAAESFDLEMVDRVYRPYDNLSLLVILKSDGNLEKKVVGSVTESLKADPACSEDWERMKEIFASPSLQIASFTITEKGYGFTGDNGIIARVTELLYHRFVNGGTPLALVSMDNCSRNGEKLSLAVKSVAERWIQEGRLPASFMDYLCADYKISFPWTMIDKITPRPDEMVQKTLSELGFEDCQTIVTGKNSYTAPFVNAEQAEYLVIEDHFPNGRPVLECGGVIFTRKETVNMVEKMKVSTCLNPIHTALAIFGCLLGYDFIWREMKDDDLRRMVEKLGYQEGMPAVTNPKIIDPNAFIKEVLEVRLPNPFLPDTPQRIATDTSQKVAVRFGETVKTYLAREDLDLSSLEVIPFIYAGWCRYLMGVDDNGNTFVPSADPLLAELSSAVQDITLGEAGDVRQSLYPILSRADVFGVDLYEAGLAEKTEAYFKKLISGPGAVRKTLREVIEN